MQKSLRLGMGIAAVAALGVLGLNLFGGKTGSYFVRAAQTSAVECLTGKAGCRDLSGGKAVTMRGPLTDKSACATPAAWQEVQGVSNGQSNIVLRCTEGARSYFYHMGKTADPTAGTEQWSSCDGDGCTGDVGLLH